MKDVLLTQSIKVAVDHGPEVHYDSTPSEAINCSGKEPINGSVPRSDVPDYWPKKKIVIIGLLTVLIVAVIVVASVIGTKKKKRPSNFESSLQSNRSVSTIISRHVEFPCIGLSRSAQDAFRSVSPQTSIFPPILPKTGEILNDSSIAVVTLQNNDRRLFYQNQTGIVKQALYLTAVNHWDAALSFVVTSDARNHTPLAALSISASDDSEVPDSEPTDQTEDVIFHNLIKVPTSANFCCDRSIYFTSQSTIPLR